MECGAGDHDTGLTVAGGVSGGRAGEEFSVLVLEGPFAAGYADVAHLLDDARRSEDVHAVGSEAECAAGFAGAARGFEDLDAEAGLFEEEGEDGASDSAADDEMRFGLVHMHYLTY